MFRKRNVKVKNPSPVWLGFFDLFRLLYLFSIDLFAFEIVELRFLDQGQLARGKINGDDEVGAFPTELWKISAKAAYYLAVCDAVLQGCKIRIREHDL